MREKSQNTNKERLSTRNDLLQITNMEQEFLCFATPQHHSFRIQVKDKHLMDKLVQSMGSISAQVYDTVSSQWVSIPLHSTTSSSSVIREVTNPALPLTNHVVNPKKRKFWDESENCESVCGDRSCAKRFKPFCDENYYWRTMNSDVKLYILSFVYSGIILKPKQMRFTVNGHEFLKTWYISQKKCNILEKAIIENLYGRLDGKVYALYLPKISVDDIHDMEATFFAENEVGIDALHRNIRSVIPWFRCSKLKVPLCDLVNIGIDKLSRTHAFPRKIKFSCTHDHILPFSPDEKSIVDVLKDRSVVHSGIMARMDISVSAGYISNEQFNQTITKLSELPRFNKCEIRTGFGSVYTIDGMIRTDAGEINFAVLKRLSNCKTLKLHYSEIEFQLTEKNIAQILEVSNMTHLTIKMLNDDHESSRFGAQAVANLASHPKLRKLNIQCGSGLGRLFLDPIAKNTRLTSLKLRFKVTPEDLINILQGGRTNLKRLKIGGNSGIHLGNQLVDSLIQTQNSTLKSLYIRGTSADTDSVMQFIKHCTSVSKLVYFEKVGLELVKRSFDRKGNTPSGILNGSHHIVIE